MIKKLKPYIISVAISLGVGGLASLLTMGNMDIYTHIFKPFNKMLCLLWGCAVFEYCDHTIIS